MYKEHYELLSDISTRDRDGVNKTFSGLMKILFPHEEATNEEIEEILKFAIEGRKRVKDQLMRIDTTYPEVKFGYTDLASKEERSVQCLEEIQYPKFYYCKGGADDSEKDDESVEDNFDQPHAGTKGSEGF